MRAVVIRTPGPPSVLHVADVPPPELPAEHARIRVLLAGVNRADLLQRMGVYPAPPGVPADIPGLEYVGVVDEAGRGTTNISVGDRVFGLTGGGAYAEQVVVHEREVALVPANLSDEEAAATPEAFVTAYDALVVRGRLAPGERLLVHAAGSGVGTAAVQIGRALGCTVIGTSRTAAKLERCRELGLDIGIVPGAGRFADAVHSGGAGADVVLDLVGGEYTAESVRACAPRGRIVVVGLTAGTIAEIDLGLLLRKRIEIIGTVLRSRPIEEKIAATLLLARHLVPWLAAGRVRPIVDKVFALEDAPAAHEYVASDASFGKVLLRVS